jgi:hypothetical protein
MFARRALNPPLHSYRPLAIAFNRRASAFRRGVQVDLVIGVQ